MKQFFFLLLFCLIFIEIYAQDCTKAIIACSYNYKLSAKERDASINEDIIYYLINTYNKTSVISSVEKNDFSSAMDEAFSPKNILLFVHGDGFNIEKLTLCGAEFADLYNVNTVLFAWASYKTSNNAIKNYNRSKKNVELSFTSFLQLVDSIKKYSQQNDVKASIIFHSLGNLFAQKYALYLHNNPNVHQFFTNIIINSACVQSKEHALWVDILCEKSSNNVYVTINKKDKILHLASTFVEHHSMLGRNPENNKSQNAHYIDFTMALKNITSDNKMPSCHTYFISHPPLENSEIRKFYDLLFHSNLVNMSDFKCFLIKSSFQITSCE